MVGRLAVVRGEGVVHRSAGVALTPGDALNHVVVLSKFSLRKSEREGAEK